MLSYKNNHAVQPLYGFYVETDLDCLDQPIDFSKKYSDQDSYDDCRVSKSSNNSTEFSASTVSQTIKQTCSDELKVYCIEGTPLTISSASSFCDLREIGTNVLQKSGMKRSFPSVNDDENAQDSFETKKSAESSDKNILEPVSGEKDEINKEVKSVSFRSGDDISKASSPLMFSRSSSVCSLNSFEQQSIIDDRSSVSVFSALTSGMISPSDLPDSPGDVMSPVLTDKACSPKIDDSSKIDSDIESENLDETDNKKMDGETLDNEINNSLPFTQVPKMEVYATTDSEGNSGDENDDAIAQQEIQLELSNDSAADLDEVFTDNNLSGQLSIDDSDEDEILQQCIQLGKPDKKSDNKCDRSTCNNVEYQSHSQNIEPKVDMAINDPDKSDNDSDGDDNILLQKCIQLGMPHKLSENVEANAKLVINSVYTHPVSHAAENVENYTNQSGNDSDGDDNILLQRCIQLGMPQKVSEKIGSNPKLIVNSKCSSSHNTKNLEMQVNDVNKSDDESDGDDNILLQRCIQLGMPQKLSKTVKAETITRHIQKDMYSQSSLKCTDDSDADDDILQHCIQLGMPSKERKKIEGHVLKKRDCYQACQNSAKSQVSEKVYPLKSEGDLDCDENEILLQRCIQFGMPKESCSTKSLQSGVCNKPEYPTQSVNHCPIKDLRDGCPDGNSDGNEDDEILEKCIRAGMPSPKAVSTLQKRYSSSPAQNISIKFQINNHSYLPETGTDSKKKFGPSHRLPQTQPYASVHSSATWISNTSFIDVDSMRIYQTEDTPILSPTASLSDLSSLSFSEDKSCHDSFLNNSRNSDCSSESDEDELLLRCIRSGMPEAKRAVA